MADVLSEGRRHLARGQLDAAERAFRQVLLKVPGHYEALCLLGVALQQRGELGEAERCYARALESQPDSAAAWFARGRIQHQLRRADAAVDSFRRTLALDPRHVGACLQLGDLLFAGDPDAGLDLFQRAFDIDPAHAGAKACLTLGHVAVGARHADAEDWAGMFAAYRRALDVDPGHAGAHFNLAVELLRHGRLVEGWREYEWRWRWKGFADRPRDFSQPQWQGGALDGARILLHGEQGHGDVIQFARYAPLVAGRGGTVFIEAYRPLVRLLAGLPGVAGVVARGERLPPFDWQCPLMSLPLAFGTTLETIPAPVPYVTAAPVPLEPDSVMPRSGARRIGLVWAGSPAHLRDERRSIPLDLFAPLTRIGGTRWYSLQYGPAAADLHTASADRPLVDLGPRLGDFADTARLVAGLDLVITVDTAAAHLAGAMGKPVWILVPKPPDWRWMLGRDESPWYPTARLFRQTARGQWAPVVERVRQALLPGAAP